MNSTSRAGRGRTPPRGRASSGRSSWAWPQTGHGGTGRAAQPADCPAAGPRGQQGHARRARESLSSAPSSGAIAMALDDASHERSQRSCELPLQQQHSNSTAHRPWQPAASEVLILSGSSFFFIYRYGPCSQGPASLQLLVQSPASSNVCTGAQNVRTVGAAGPS